MSEFPNVRLRRLRQNENLRKLFSIEPPSPSKFIWPVFVIPGINKKEPIESMPGQFRFSIDVLCKELPAVINMGIKSILIFGIAQDGQKDDKGSDAYSEKGIVQKTIKVLKKEFPQLTIFSDVCLCAYTDHGHCGVLNKNGVVENDATNDLLAKVALSHAAAGVDCVAPSAMMDGQIAAIRNVLDKNNYTETLLMSYSSKFASTLYGPFRDAEQSAPGDGDRKGYQAPYNDLSQALRESELDEKEGADILMVKPSLYYLDIVSKIKANSKLPLAVYNVSGEYSMIHAMAQNGWGDLYPMAAESLYAFKRAGADLIISYWANEYNKIFS